MPPTELMRITSPNNDAVVQTHAAPKMKRSLFNSALICQRFGLDAELLIDNTGHSVWLFRPLYCARTHRLQQFRLVLGAKRKL